MDTQRKNKGNGVGVNVQLPAALHRQLRIKAVSNKQTLAVALTDAVRLWVKTK